MVFRCKNCGAYNEVDESMPRADASTQIREAWSDGVAVVGSKAVVRQPGEFGTTHRRKPASGQAQAGRVASAGSDSGLLLLRRVDPLRSAEAELCADEPDERLNPG